MEKSDGKEKRNSYDPRGSALLYSPVLVGDKQGFIYFSIRTIQWAD